MQVESVFCGGIKFIFSEVDRGLGDCPTHELALRSSGSGDTKNYLFVDTLLSKARMQFLAGSGKLCQFAKSGVSSLISQGEASQLCTVGRADLLSCKDAGEFVLLF